ncbi:hypothetical protein KKA95_05415 [Patescibacteria group bacterium]|nr:hypothetical protein [Patescibacteria group bacterium]
MKTTAKMGTFLMAVVLTVIATFNPAFAADPPAEKPGIVGKVLDKVGEKAGDYTQQGAEWVYRSWWDGVKEDYPSIAFLANYDWYQWLLGYNLLYGFILVFIFSLTLILLLKHQEKKEVDEASGVGDIVEAVLRGGGSCFVFARLVTLLLELMIEYGDISIALGVASLLIPMGAIAILLHKLLFNPQWWSLVKEAGFTGLPRLINDGVDALPDEDDEQPPAPSDTVVPPVPGQLPQTTSPPAAPGMCSCGHQRGAFCTNVNCPVDAARAQQPTVAPATVPQAAPSTPASGSGQPSRSRLRGKSLN